MALSGSFPGRGDLKHFEGGGEHLVWRNFGEAGFRRERAEVFEARLARERFHKKAVAVTERAGPIGSGGAEEDETWGSDGGGHVDGAGIVGDKEVAVRKESQRFGDGSFSAEINDTVGGGMSANFGGGGEIGFSADEGDCSGRNGRRKQRDERRKVFDRPILGIPAGDRGDGDERGTGGGGERREAEVLGGNGRSWAGDAEIIERIESLDGGVAIAMDEAGAFGVEKGGTLSGIRRADFARGAGERSDESAFQKTVKVDGQIVVRFTEGANCRDTRAQEVVSWERENGIDIGKSLDERGEFRVRNPIDLCMRFGLKSVDAWKDVKNIPEGTKFYDENTHKIQVLSIPYLFYFRTKPTFGLVVLRLNYLWNFAILDTEI